MAIKRPIPRAEGVSETINDEVLFSSYSIIMKSGKTLQEEWDEHLRELEELKENLGTVKEFVGDHIAIPYQSKKIYYSPGTYQEPAWKGYNSQFMTKSGQETGINAGEYKVTFKFTDPEKYTWSDGTNGEQVVSWYIDRQSFSSDPVQKEPYPEYDGDLKQPLWKDHTSLELEVVGGDSEHSGAGTHEIYLKPRENYAWHDGGYDERKFTWKITRKKISLPVQVGIIYYDGKVKTPTWDENGKTTLVTIVDGSREGTEAKTYDVWFKPTDNAMWQDGSTDMRKTTWTISAAALGGDVTGPDGRTEGIVLTFNGSDIKPDFRNYDPSYIDAVDISTDKDGNIVESKVIAHRNVGSYVTKFTPNGNSTWTNGSKTAITIQWEIQPMSIKVPSIKYNNMTSDIKISYSGTDIGPELVDYDSTWVTVESATGVRVKEYTTKFTLKEANNTRWESGGTIAKSYSWQIVPRLVKVPKLIDNVVPYNNGLAVSPTIEPYDTNLIRVSDNVASNVGSNYQVKFELIDPESSAWDDETHSTGPKYASWSIAPVSAAPPTVTGNLFTFNGSDQGPVISEYDPQQIQVTDNLKTNVGNYTMVLHLLKRGVVWSDTGDAQDKTFSWQIKPKQISVPVVSNKENKIYNKNNQYVIVTGNDGEKDFTINNGTTPTDKYDSKYLSVSGASGKNANSYEVLFDLKDKNNTVWTTGGTDIISVSWVISKKFFNVPVVAGTYTFNASEQTCIFAGYNSDFMTVTGDKATAVGSYTASFSLTDPVNTAWSDNTSDPKSVVWSITAVGIDPSTLSIHDADVTYDGDAHKITAANITGFSDDIFRLDGDLNKTAAGRYTVRIYLKDTTVNQWSDSRAVTDPVELVWNISKRALKVPTIKNPSTQFEYNGKEITVTLDHCNFDTEADKNFITLKNNKGTDAGDYFLAFSIKQEHSGSCTWADGTTTDEPAAWKINKTYITKWSVSDSQLDITGAAGSSDYVYINRPGDGLVKVQLKENDVVSAEVVDGTGDDPEIYFTDKCGVGETTAIISVDEGTNYYSSSKSSEQHSSCKASWSCNISVLTNVDPENLTPEEIVNIVKRGYAPSVWPVGTIIPVELSRFRLSGKGNDYIPAGKYGAVVLGYDHNMAVETPNAKHTMTLAIMKYYESLDGITTSWLKKKSTTIAFMDRNGNAEDLYTGLYDGNVYSALSRSWQGTIVKVQNKNRTLKTVFQLAVREVYGNGGPENKDDKNTVLQYDYFKQHSFVNEKEIYQISGVTSSNKIRVGSRSVANIDNISLDYTPLLNYPGQIYDLDEAKFIDYNENDHLSVRMHLYPYYGTLYCMVGMIPCFVIGG